VLLISLTYNVLTTAQPGYLRNLISVDSPFIVINSFSSVTLSRPSSSFSLKITDRKFRYASPCLWNKLPASFRQPNPDHSFAYSSQPNSLTQSIICPMITTDTFSFILPRPQSTPSTRLPLRTPDCSVVFFLFFSINLLVWFVQ